MSDKMWARRSNWVGTPVEDQFVMVDIDGGQYVSLNETATAIWQAMESPCDEAAIVGKVRARFDVPADRCAEAVARVLGELETMRLIETC